MSATEILQVIGVVAAVGLLAYLMGYIPKDF